jgi:HD-like signal output (HDOD) protein
MSFFEKLSADMLKYSKKFVNKTDIVAQIAKLNIDIKKKDREIVKAKIEIGDYILEHWDRKDQLIDNILK